MPASPETWTVTGLVARIELVYLSGLLAQIGTYRGGDGCSCAMESFQAKQPEPNHELATLETRDSLPSFNLSSETTLFLGLFVTARKSSAGFSCCVVWSFLVPLSGLWFFAFSCRLVDIWTASFHSTGIRRDILHTAPRQAWICVLFPHSKGMLPRVFWPVVSSSNFAR